MAKVVEHFMGKLLSTSMEVSGAAETVTVVVFGLHVITKYFAAAQPAKAKKGRESAPFLAKKFYST